jgi:hypothetical protein
LQTAQVPSRHETLIRPTYVGYPVVPIPGKTMKASELSSKMFDGADLKSLQQTVAKSMERPRTDKSSCALSHSPKYQVTLCFRRFCACCSTILLDKLRCPYYHVAPGIHTDYIVLRLRTMVQDNGHCMFAFHVILMLTCPINGSREMHNTSS